MSAIELRDKLFSQIHTEWLKPRGYKKSANWSYKWVGDFLFGVALRSSRWCTPELVHCWIDLKVFHQGCHKALLGQVLGHPKEATPNIFFEELGEIDGHEHCLIQITPLTSIEDLKLVLFNRLERQQAHLEEAFQTLASAIEFYKARSDWPRLALNAATVALVLGNESEAAACFQLAHTNAPTQESAAWVKQRELHMRRNIGMEAS